MSKHVMKVTVQAGRETTIIDAGPDAEATFNNGRLHLRGPQCDLHYDDVKRFKVEYVEAGR